MSAQRELKWLCSKTDGASMLKSWIVDDIRFYDFLAPIHGVLITSNFDRLNDYVNSEYRMYRGLISTEIQQQTQIQHISKFNAFILFLCNDELLENALFSLFP